MTYGHSFLHDSSAPSLDFPGFIPILKPIVTHGIEVSPSEDPANLATYEKIGLMQACVDSIIDNVRNQVNHDLTNRVIPSRTTVQVETILTDFLNQQGIENGMNIFSFFEKEDLIDEVVEQLRVQGIAEFDESFKKDSSTYLTFIRT